MRKFYLGLIVFFFFFINKSFSQVLLSESFDATSFAPTGWYNSRILPSLSTTTGIWDRVTAGTNPVLAPHSGAGMARFNSPTAGFGTSAELGTSALDFSSGSAYRLRFWLYRGDNAQFNSDMLDIYVNAQPNITGAVKLQNFFISRVKTPTEAANGWYEYMADIPATFNTNSNYIIFRATGASSNVIYLDDVTVETYTCKRPQTPSVNNILTSSAILNWTAPLAGTPAGYEWELRTNGSPGTGATGLAASGSTGSTITTASAGGLTPGITHYFYVRSNCGAEKSTWTGAVVFNTSCDASNIPYLENFDGIATGIPTCTQAENINGGNAWTSLLPIYPSSYSKSAPNALAVTPGGTGASGAQNDWFFTAPLNLEAGKCYQLSFAYRTYYWQFTQGMKVKIGTAQNAAAMTGLELFNNAAITNDAYNTTTNTFSVSATGVYYIGFQHYFANSNGPLLIDDISVTESVGVPTGINANPINAITSQLNWIAPACGTVTGYDWELRKSGAAGSGATGLINAGSGTGLSNSFSGLTENTVYAFYIRCKTNSATSAWSNTYSFTTGCSIRPLPYIQNFDGVIAPALPACMLKQDIKPPYNPSFNSWITVALERPNSSPNSMRCGTNNSTDAADNWFFTPPFNFEAGKSYRVSFYYRTSAYQEIQKLEVKYGQDANAAAMTSAPLFSNINIRNPLYKKAVVDFTPAQNGINNIGFHIFSAALGGFLYIDDLVVEATPSCDVVREINSRDISAKSALVLWTAPLAGNPLGYNWEVRTSGAAGSGATGLAASGNLPAGALSLPLNNLSAATTYTFYIRSSCGIQNSEWVSSVFTTSCNAVQVPYMENFDGVASNSLPPCTRIEELYDQYNWYVTPGLPHSAPNALYHSYNFTSPFDDWFFTAPLQLQAGKIYKLNFYYRQVADIVTEIDAIEVKIGRYAQGDSMLATPLYTNANVTIPSYQLANTEFTVPSSGIYYLGFHSLIPSYSWGVLVDDISVDEIKPDLVITNHSVSAGSVGTGGTVTANFTIANQGVGQASIHKTLFYLSADNTLTPGANGDTLIGEYSTIAALPANSNTGSLAKQLKIPCGLTPGNYSLFFVADGESIVAESNEGNNRQTAALSVTAGASIPATPVIISSPGSSVCNGNPVTLTANAANCASCSYTWNTGAVGNSIIVTQSGVYTVNAANTCGTSSTIQMVTINSTPQVDLSPSATDICLGSAFTLTANGADSYNWSGQALSATTGAVVNATPTLAGVLNYTVYGTSNGCTDTSTITVTVHAIPVVSIAQNDTTICNGRPVTLAAAGATTYSWSPTAGLSSTTVASVTATPSATTSYTVTGTSNGCSSSDNVTLTVIPTVTPSLTISYTGCGSDSIRFTTNPVNGGTSPVYQWLVNNVVSGSGPTFALAGPVTNAQVKCILTSNATCANPETASAVTTLTCLTTPVSSIDGLEEFSVAPNPSPGLFVVRFRLIQLKRVSFTVMDAAGKSVYQTQPASVSGIATRQIDLSKMMDGIYYLKTIIDKKHFVIKLVKHQ